MTKAAWIQAVFYAMMKRSSAIRVSKLSLSAVAVAMVALLAQPSVVIANTGQSSIQSEKKATAKPKPMKPAADNKQRSESLVRQHSQTTDQIKNLRRSISQDARTKQSLEQRLKRSEAEIARVQSNLQKLKKEHATAVAELSKQTKQKVRIENEMMHERQILEEINRQRIEQKTLKDRPNWLGGSDPDYRMRSEMMLELLAKKSAQSYRKLEVQQRQLAQVLSTTKKLSDRLAVMEVREKKENDKLARQREQHRQTVLQLQAELEQKNSELKKLQQDEKRLFALMQRLKAKSTTQSKMPAKPQANKGVNPIKPVDGTLVARFGQKRGESKQAGSWKGLVYSVRTEKPVKAVRSGKVVFADYMSGYGNLMIIDHGGDYFSLYGNNARMVREIGDDLKAGEVISYVGSKSGGISILYFELRHKGVPVNPAKWVGF